MTTESHDIDKLVGQWVSLLWNGSAGQGHVHPDDSSRLPEAGGVVCLCVARDGEYLLVDAPSGLARVAPFTAVLLPRHPKFLRGSIVQTKGGLGHSPRTSSVAGLGWHFKAEEYVYHLSGTTKRYYERDLIGAGE